MEYWIREVRSWECAREMSRTSQIIGATKEGCGMAIRGSRWSELGARMQTQISREIYLSDAIQARRVRAYD